MRTWPWAHVLALGLSSSASSAWAEDLPDWRAGPAKFAVTPFENHVPNGRALDWMIAETPFEMAEKTEGVLGLDPLGGALFVGADPVPAEPETVFDFGKKVGAEYVITGWYDKPGDNLRIDAIVWKLDKTTAKVAGEAQQQGPMTSYHKLLGDTLGQAWTKAGISVDLERGERLERGLSKDVYPVFMMGRGLGYFSGALGGKPDLKSAQHDLERAVFLDPKLYEAQRLIGELDLLAVGTDPKAANRAAGKFNYASDLAPDDIPALRAAARASAQDGKWEVAQEQLKKLVGRRPWDLDARYQLGAAMWQLGDGKGAERQLEQVTQHAPDHLAARRVLVLIHASRSDTRRLVTELEAIAARAPADLEIKGDLATAYGSLGEWPKAIAALETIATAQPNDLPLLVRVGDAHRENHDVDGAIAWYSRASKLAPDSSLPGFAIAQAQYDAGRLADAQRTYTALQKFGADEPAAWEALGAIALAQGRGDDAAWYLRRAVHDAPRSQATREALIAAELLRKDAVAAQKQLEPALAAWPHDANLHYLAGIAHHLRGDGAAARTELAAALAAWPGMQAARSALARIDAGGSVQVELVPTLVRPWGDGEALQQALDRYAQVQAAMASVRVAFQSHFLQLLGAVGSGPMARVKAGSVRSCPFGEVASSWKAAQDALATYERLGVQLETEYRFLVRHDEAGLTAGLLPNARAALADAKKSYKLALADVGELRAEWTRGLAPELRAAGCNERLLAAAAADPSRYHVIEEDKPEVVPTQTPPRAKPRSTFFVDNSKCHDAVEVWIDGGLVGQVAPGRRSALVSDGGERTLCLLGPGAARCGDRGTVRQVYLHDGWSVTMHCVK
jgi:Flp pilus assembly protein TadD